VPGVVVCALCRYCQNARYSPINQGIQQLFAGRKVGVGALGVGHQRDGQCLHGIGLLDLSILMQGVALPLFGRPARTTLGIAKLAIDKNLPIVPVHLERLGGARFRITLEEPVALPRLGDRQEEAKAMMTEVNRIIERWIRQRPGDWLWLHRRWDRP